MMAAIIPARATIPTAMAGMIAGATATMDRIAAIGRIAGIAGIEATMRAALNGRIGITAGAIIAAAKTIRAARFRHIMKSVRAMTGAANRL